MTSVPSNHPDVWQPRRQATRQWTELRIRRADLVEDKLTLPIQRLREAVSELIKGSEDKDTGQELMECNRRLAELREGVSMFLSQTAGGLRLLGRAQRQGAKESVAQRRASGCRCLSASALFGSDTSVIMTSATLAVAAEAQSSQAKSAGRPNAPMMYFARKVGAERATLLQVGSPFDYERQMKLFVAAKMPDPRDRGYSDALVDNIEHFIRQTHGKAFVLFTSYKLMQEVAERMQPFFDTLGLACFVQGTGTPRSVMLEKFKDDIGLGVVRHGQFLAGRGCAGRSAFKCHHHAAAVRGARSSANRGED